MRVRVLTFVSCYPAPPSVPTKSSRSLGAGGMGEVFKDRRARGWDRIVALKIIRPDKVIDEERRQRFHQEAQGRIAPEPTRTS